MTILEILLKRRARESQRRGLVPQPSSPDESSSRIPGRDQLSDKEVIALAVGAPSGRAPLSVEITGC